MSLTVDYQYNDCGKDIKSTLLVILVDNINPPTIDIKYDHLYLYNPRKNPWFFYHLESYIKILKNVIFTKRYQNLIIIGGSKGASASIVLSKLLCNQHIYNKIISWAMCPVMEIYWNKTIPIAPKLSKSWDRIKDDEQIKGLVNRYGNIYSLLDCSFPIIYSYSYSDIWMFDKNNFDNIINKNCIIEDYIENSDALSNFAPKYPPYQNIHNIFGYYLKVETNLFHTKLEKYIGVCLA